MEFLYKSDSLEDVFRGYFVGPEKLPHHERTLIAKFEDNEESDGYAVEVYCVALPAQFFEIVALNSKNSIGEEQIGFTLSTGSGCAEESFRIAKLLNEGMLKLQKIDGKKAN